MPSSTSPSSRASSASLPPSETDRTPQQQPQPKQHPKTPRTVADTILIKLHPRKGQPLTHCRAPKDFPGAFDLSLSTEHDSYTTFCSKIRAQLVAALPDYAWPRDAHPYLRPTHSATQTHYKELTDDNFESKIIKAWRTEARRLNGTEEEVYIHVFAYLIKAEKGVDVLSNSNSSSGSGRVGRRTHSSANHTTADTTNTTAGGSIDLVNGATGSGGRSAKATVGNGINTGSSTLQPVTSSSPTTRYSHPARSTIAGT
ncbi:hypothetical protein BGZ70_004715, partial [Mortierella alpina]